MAYATIEEMYSDIQDMEVEFDHLFTTWGVWNNSTLGLACMKLSQDQARQIGDLSNGDYTLTHVDEDGYTLTGKGSQGVNYAW